MGIEGTGLHRFYTADVEWTFPPEFAELVWGDGKTSDREVVVMNQMAPLSNHRFRIPFDVAGKKWVRFAVWDLGAGPTGLYVARLHNPAVIVQLRAVPNLPRPT